MAQEMLDQKLAQWRKKVSLGVSDTTDKTFSELVDWYLSLPGTKAKRSYSKDVERAKILRVHFGEYPARLIKPSMVESFQYRMLATNSRYEKTYKPATVNRMVSLMRRILNLAVRDDLIEKNPCWKVPLLSENNERNRVLSLGELDRLEEILPQHSADVLLVGFHTGMRLGEILGLTWERVNLKSGYIALDRGKTKTDEARGVYFSLEALRDVFQRAAKIRSLEHNFVFTYKGKPLKRITRSLKTACRKAGIENFTFHDLRHTFNTNLRRSGVPQSVIMKITGHRTTEMFNRYNTVDNQDAARAIKLYERFLTAEREDLNSLLGSMIKEQPDSLFPHYLNTT